MKKIDKVKQIKYSTIQKNSFFFFYNLLLLESKTKGNMHFTEDRLLSKLFTTINNIFFSQLLYEYWIKNIRKLVKIIL